MSECTIKYSDTQIKEIKRAFKDMDITEEFPLNPDFDLTPIQAWLFQKVKCTFMKYYDDILPKLGINRPMNNFSENHPVKLLINTDGNIIAQCVLLICQFADEWLGDDYVPDEENCENIDITYDDLIKTFDILTDFFNKDSEEGEEFETLCRDYINIVKLGLQRYAQSKHKELSDLTGEEIVFVVGKVFDIINEEQNTVLAIGQQMPELFDLAHAEPAEEDYSNTFSFDKVNFDVKWNHSKTKIGTLLSLDELRENNEFDIADNEYNEADYKLLRDTFVQSITDDTDYQIFIMREKGMTEQQIAEKLSYRTHKPVCKRLKKMKEQFYEFTDMVEESYKK